MGRLAFLLEGGRNGSSESFKVKTESILEALELCLKNNYFSFNKKIYQQVGGVGTGIKSAPLMPVWEWGNLKRKPSKTKIAFWTK